MTVAPADNQKRCRCAARVISCQIDLTSVAANIQSETFRSFEVYIVVAVIYLALSLAFNLLFKLIYQMFLNYPDRR